MSTPARHPIIEEDLRQIAAADLPWALLAGKTVLVTGANGFLPAYMVETLLYRNEHAAGPATQVIGLVRNRARAEARFAAYRGRPDLRLLVQDVCEPVVLAEPVHFIIHAASQASPKYYGRDPVGTDDHKIDLAFGHKRRSGSVGNDHMGDLFVKKFPGGQPGPLTTGPCLVHINKNIFSGP